MTTFPFQCWATFKWYNGWHTLSPTTFFYETCRMEWAAVSKIASHNIQENSAYCTIGMQPITCNGLVKMPWSLIRQIYPGCSHPAHKSYISFVVYIWHTTDATGMRTCKICTPDFHITPSLIPETLYAAKYAEKKPMLLSQWPRDPPVPLSSFPSYMIRMSKFAYIHLHETILTLANDGQFGAKFLPLWCC